MTGLPPDGPAGAAARGWSLRPRVALPAVALFIALVAVLTPEPIDGRSGDPRLTTRSTSANGASIFYQLTRRLGWRVERRERSSLPGDPNAIHVVLDPPTPPSATETHALLEHVRRGGALLYVMSGAGPLNDSLHVRRGAGNIAVLYPDVALTPVPAPGTTGRAARHETDDADEDDEGAEDNEGEDPHGCRRGENGAAPMWADGQIRLWAIRWRRAPPTRRIVFAATQPSWTDSAGSATPAAVGFEYGRGRVVVAADPDLLRNDVLRVCAWDADVTAVRMLEYLSEVTPGGSAPRRKRVVFDEYHQGYGDQPSMSRAVNVFLTQTAGGHAVAQLAAAGLVLVLALGPRGIPPRDAERVQRRSPLEHVSALARAYVQTSATRTAAALLLRGVRRRVERAGGSATSGRDANAFLEWAVAQAPDRADDVRAIRRALGGPISRRELEAVGSALRRLESSLSARRA
ncbi:MAG: DUF4350 domain-containing protein [Gemmatimonadaceae bacterium]